MIVVIGCTVVPDAIAATATNAVLKAMTPLHREVLHARDVNDVVEELRVKLTTAVEALKKSPSEIVVGVPLGTLPLNAHFKTPWTD